MADEALQVLLIYAYPGNIRELENILERAVLLADGETVGLSDLPAELRGIAAPEETGDLKTASRGAAIRASRARIVQALEGTGGNVTHAAKRLGLSRRGLQLKMKEYGLREAAADPPRGSRKRSQPDQEEIL